MCSVSDYGGVSGWRGSSGHAMCNHRKFRRMSMPCYRRGPTEASFQRYDGPDGLAIRVPLDEAYRTYAECGADCDPEPTAVDGLGVRLAFVRPKHGVQKTGLTRFEDERCEPVDAPSPSVRGHDEREGG